MNYILASLNLDQDVLAYIFVMIYELATCLIKFRSPCLIFVISLLNSNEIRVYLIWGKNIHCPLLKYHHLPCFLSLSIQFH
jgi:hypothetical protein